MVKPAPTHPLGHIATKEPTALHEGFANWIKEQTGHEVDLKSVQLATVLRMAYQRSETNQSSIAAKKTAKEEAEAKRALARKERAAAKELREKERSEKAAAKGAKGGEATAAKNKAAKATAESDPADVAEEALAEDKPKPRRRSRAKAKTVEPETTETTTETVADEVEEDETDF